jgi:hypothetical protein
LITLLNVKALVIAPATPGPSLSGMPCRNHWKASGSVPMALRLNVAVVLASLVRLTGCTVITGRLQASSTK